MCQKLTSCGNQHRPWHIFIPILQSFPATGHAFSGCFFAAALYTEWSTTRLRSVGWGCSIATSQQICDNQNRTMTSVKTVHHLIGEDYWKLVWWDGLAKKKFQSFRVYQASLIPSRPEAIYIIYFRVTAWLNNFSSVRQYAIVSHHESLSHPERKGTWSIDRLKCSASIGGFGAAVPLQPTYPARQSESNYDFCENQFSDIKLPDPKKTRGIKWKNIWHKECFHPQTALGMCICVNGRIKKVIQNPGQLNTVYHRHTTMWAGRHSNT